ncbi:MAG: SGNH/GDSL hydrolase family protein [Ilumatobacteraceae bacterium]
MARHPRQHSATTAARFVAAAALGLVASIGAQTLAVPGPAHAAAVPFVRSAFVATPGPLGPVTLIGDSVLVGASYEPSLPTLLAARGWGPITYRAGAGFTAGNFQPAGSEASAANWITWWRQAGWDPPNVVVNLGSNDVGFCGPDVDCNADTIRYLLDRIGPGHTVWWSTITRVPALAAEQAAYNRALEIVAAERPSLHLWDWAAAAAANAIAIGPDGTHLRDTASYRRRSELMAADITAQLTVATRVGGDAPVPVASGAPSEYLPLDPVRVLDTRQASGARLAAGDVRTIALAGLVPAGSRAVAVSLTSADPATQGFLTADACGQRPNASSANYAPGGARAAFAVVPLDADGRLCVYSSAATDLIVDLQGAFVGHDPPVEEATRFTPRAPERLVDTRATGRAAMLVMAAPAGSSGVAVNLTATGASAQGYLTAFPCGGTVPVVSNVNFLAGETIAGSAFVPVGVDGRVCVFSSVPVDVIVDLTGTFAPDGALAYTPAAPTRVFDTRNAIGGWSPVQGIDQTIDVRAAPETAVAVTGTVTMVGPPGAGFATVFGCGAVPPTSNVNVGPGAVLANSVTAGLAPAGRLCIRTSTMSHVLFDVAGWWSP